MILQETAQFFRRRLLNCCCSELEAELSSVQEELNILQALYTASVNFFKRKPSEYFVPLTFEYLQHKRNIYEGYWYRKPSFLLIKRNTPEVIDIDNLQ